jgi:hypothetical protein
MKPQIFIVENHYPQYFTNASKTVRNFIGDIKEFLKRKDKTVSAKDFLIMKGYLPVDTIPTYSMIEDTFRNSGR